MVFHSNDKNWAALLINSTKSILAGCVYFVNYLLSLANFIGLIALIPFYPFRPHLIHLIFLELSGNAESRHGVNVGVEIAAMFQMSEFFIEYLNYLLLLCLNLS